MTVVKREKVVLKITVKEMNVEKGRGIQIANFTISSPQTAVVLTTCKKTLR
jgi:hypothetical protein